MAKALINVAFNASPGKTYPDPDEGAGSVNECDAWIAPWALRNPIHVSMNEMARDYIVSHTPSPGSEDGGTDPDEPVEPPPVLHIQLVCKGGKWGGTERHSKPRSAVVNVNFKPDGGESGGGDGGGVSPGGCPLIPWGVFAGALSLSFHPALHGGYGQVSGRCDFGANGRVTISVSATLFLRLFYPTFAGLMDDVPVSYSRIKPPDLKLRVTPPRLLSSQRYSETTDCRGTIREYETGRVSVEMAEKGFGGLSTWEPDVTAILGGGDCVLSSYAEATAQGGWPGTVFDEAGRNVYVEALDGSGVWARLPFGGGTMGTTIPSYTPVVSDAVAPFLNVEVSTTAPFGIKATMKRGLVFGSATSTPDGGLDLKVTHFLEFGGELLPVPGGSNFPDLDVYKYEKTTDLRFGDGGIGPNGLTIKIPVDTEIAGNHIELKEVEGSDPKEYGLYVNGERIPNTAQADVFHFGRLMWFLGRDEADQHKAYAYVNGKRFEPGQTTAAHFILCNHESSYPSALQVFSASGFKIVRESGDVIFESAGTGVGDRVFEI